MPEVALERVSKVYPTGTVALHDLTLHVAHGELLVLVGPSGCGKTTTLRLIAGLEDPSSGTVRFNGRAMDGVPPAQRDVGFAFQRSPVYPHRTVRDNLALSLRLRNGGRWRQLLTPKGRQAAQEQRNRVSMTAKMLGLDELLDRFPGQLSGGQQQRVALGRALIRQPGVLLLDEPFSNLDATLRRDLRRELHLLQQQLKATMVYVTHDPVEALCLGDRVAVLSEGELRQVDRPEALLCSPANRFVAGFVGWPPMNLVDGELYGEAGVLWFQCSLGKLRVAISRADQWKALSGRPLTLGIRPENIEIVPTGTPNGCSIGVQSVEFGTDGHLVTLSNGVIEIVVWLRDGCQSSKLSDIMSPGSSVMALLKLEHGHLFDRTSGVSLAGLPAG